MKPIINKGDEVKMNKICSLAGVRLGTLVKADGFGGAEKSEDIICPQYAVGKCTFPNCKRAHLYCAECPEGFGQKFGNAIVPGVAKWMAGERPTPHR